VFRHHITDLWRRTLRRRSQKDRMTWERMTQLVDDCLPKPMILHPWPSDRFAVTHPRWESRRQLQIFLKLGLSGLSNRRWDCALLPTTDTKARPTAVGSNDRGEQLRWRTLNP
jgi:hypothetical protein